MFSSRRTSSLLAAQTKALLRAQCALVDANDAASFAVDRHGKVAAHPIVHLRDDHDAAYTDAAVKAFREVCQKCVDDAKDGCVNVEGSVPNDGKLPRFCFVVLLKEGRDILGANAIVARSENQEAAMRLLQSLQARTFPYVPRHDHKCEACGVPATIHVSEGTIGSSRLVHYCDKHFPIKDWNIRSMKRPNA